MENEVRRKLKKELKEEIGRKRTVRPPFDKEGSIPPVHRVEGATAILIDFGQCFLKKVHQAVANMYENATNTGNPPANTGKAHFLFHPHLFLPL